MFLSTHIVMVTCIKSSQLPIFISSSFDSKPVVAVSLQNSLHKNKHMSYMECRKFELTLISASDLEDVRNLFKMKVYAKVSIGGNPETEKITPADKHGETNPAWNFSMKYTVGESAVQQHNVMLVIRLYCKRKLGDRYVGEVHTPIKELFDHAHAYGASSAVVSYPVKKGSVNSQGVLQFGYRFGECVDVEKVLLAENFSDWSKYVD